MVATCAAWEIEVIRTCMYVCVYVCVKGRYVRIDEEVCKVVKVDPDGLLHVLRGRLR